MAVIFIPCLYTCSTPLYSLFFTAVTVPLPTDKVQIPYLDILCPFFSTCSLTPVLHLPQDTCLSCFLTPGLCSSCFTPLWGPSTPPPTEILPIHQMPSPPSETPGCFQLESTSPSHFCTSTVPHSFLLSMPWISWLGMGLPPLSDGKLETEFAFIFGLFDAQLNCTE